MSILPQFCRAEKITYGEFITYDGKVDGNGLPYGKGKIETTYGTSNPNALSSKEKDVLEGIFENGTVKDAKLLLHRYNGPMWINTAKYKGIIEYSIAKDGSSITYKLTDGKFETNRLTTFVIQPEFPFTLTRTPHKVGCDMDASNLYTPNNNVSIKVEDINSSYFFPLQLSDLGDIKQITQVNSYRLDSDFKEYSNGTDYIVQIENGGILSKTKDGVNYNLSNKDYFYASSNSSSTYKFRKTYPEGLLSYEGGSCYHFEGSNGEKGIITVNSQDDSNKIYGVVMKSGSLKETGFTILKGQIAELTEKAYAGDAQSQYELGLAYLNGNGIDKDQNIGENWIRIAAKKGNSDAIAKLEADEAEKRAKEKEMNDAKKQSEGTSAQKDATIDAAIKLTNGGMFLDKNYVITKPLTVLSMEGKNYNIDPSKNKATLEIINFKGNGNTVIMTIDLGTEGVFTFSWSGKNVHVVPAYVNGPGMLSVMRGDKVCGVLGTTDGIWLAAIPTTKDTYCISDFKKGMSRAEVEKALSGLGVSQFKLTRNEGNLQIYSLFWIDMKKRYNALGTDYSYSMTNDKKYGDFYFDARGKLVKWLLFF